MQTKHRARPKFYIATFEYNQERDGGGCFDWQISFNPGDQRVVAIRVETDENDNGVEYKEWSIPNERRAYKPCATHCESIMSTIERGSNWHPDTGKVISCQEWEALVNERGKVLSFNRTEK